MRKGRQKKKNEAAVHEYHNAIRYGPNNAEIYYQMGLAYGKLNKTDNALSAYNKAIALDKNMVNAYINSGVILRRDDYKKAVEIDPGNSDAEQNLKTVEAISCCRNLGHLPAG